VAFGKASDSYWPLGHNLRIRTQLCQARVLFVAAELALGSQL
jgi:hypothetical protein